MSLKMHIHARAPIVIAWTRVHAIDVPACIAIASNAFGNAMCPARVKLRRNLVLHGEKKKGEYKYRGDLTLLRYRPNTITMAH